VTITSKRTFTFAAGVAAALLLAACGSSSGGSSLSSGSGGSATSAPSAGGGTGAATVARHTTSLGSVLTDSSGKTLYLLSSDTAMSTTCTGGCLTIWMPLVAPSSGSPQAGAGVTTTLGVFTRPDGTKQVTAGNHPVYTYAGDSGAGSTSGQGIQSFGGTWSALNTSGSAATGSTGGATSSPSTGGYTY
jgi:predicted lipoprotein with Yx(FWY)xxD motif